MLEILATDKDAVPGFGVASSYCVILVRADSFVDRPTGVCGDSRPRFMRFRYFMRCFLCVRFHYVDMFVDALVTGRVPRT